MYQYKINETETGFDVYRNGLFFLTTTSRDRAEYAIEALYLLDKNEAEKTHNRIDLRLNKRNA